MALRKIVTVDNDESQLRLKSKKVTIFDDKLKQLIEDLKETMLKEDGLGLAAPQVGILKRIVICNLDYKAVALINPEITDFSGEMVDVEGCLSVPGKRGEVKRPAYVKVTAQNSQGEKFTLEGNEYTARLFCHEIDHLDGILYIDKASKVYDV